MRQLYDSTIRLARLYIDSARLVTTEKLTVLLSTIAIYALSAIIGFTALVFLSIGLGNLLEAAMSPVWAYMIIAGFYVGLFAVLILLRKQLIINPIARFLSRLLLDAPKDATTTASSSDDATPDDQPEMTDDHVTQ